MLLNEIPKYFNIFYKLDLLMLNFIHTFNKNFFYKKYKFLLFRVRYKIKNSKTPNDLIHLLKFICYWFNCKSNDEISNIITNCFSIYPLNIYEIEKLSKWQQYYQHDTGIYSFVTMLTWICYIQVAMEQEELIKKTALPLI